MKLFSWFTFKNLVKVLVFLLIISGSIFYAIDLIQEKNNLMDIEEYAPKSTLVVSENAIVLSLEADIVAIVPENPPSKLPKEPAAVENVGVSDTVNIEPDKTASPSPFSILILYEPSTGKVAVTVIVVELLNATESAK